ncbi:MAG: hypothetical protein ABSD49_10450 [Candidatus Bathyarchaeia archaeon]
MKRTPAAFMVFLGLTAIMIGIYLNEFQSLATVLRTYVIQFL